MTTVRGRVWAGAAAVGWLALAVRPAVADPPKLVGETPRTAQRFAEAAELEQQHRWGDAVELYLRLLDEAGDDLVPADGDPRHLLPARGLVHRRIAARPELLAPYRDRVEPRAKRLLEQGRANRDPQPLEQVVDLFFCSRSADAALQLLGDLACERGDFEQARHDWHLLEPADAPRGLAYPDPAGGPALARAKQILARLLAGQRTAAAKDFTSFRKSHPDAAGHLAGRDGNLAAILQALLDTADTVRVPAPAGIAPAATTFAGDPSRNGILAGVLPPFAPREQYPPIRLPDDSRPDRTRPGPRPPVRPAALAFYPVIARGQVFVADARRVLAYDLATGQLSGRFDLLKPDDDPPAWAKTKLPLNAGGAFTLTVDGDRLYARLGPPHMRPGRGESASVLVGLQWCAERPSPDERLHVRWTLPAAKPDADTAAAWEGTPVVRDGRLFAALTRVDGTRAVTAVACYDADDPSAGPTWQRDVYEAAADTADRTRPHLLTLAGPTVVLCSHAGVIVGLDAATGRRAWAVRYPSQESGPTRSDLGPRDPAPAVFAGGRLYAAPADAGCVLCLDAASGAPRWTSDPVDVAHLLGVAGGRVVCAVGGFHAGLCALDAATGRRLPEWGYRVAGADALAPFGRGLLCADRVYWPTRAAGVMELRRDGTTGYPPTAFRELPGGNLAYGDGSLVVATADRLHVLVAPPAEAAGMGQPVGRRHDLLLWRADVLARTGRPAAEVRAAFAAAAGPEFPPERRFLALVRRAEYERSAGRPEAASAVARSVREAADVRRVSVRDADGVIRSARNWSGERGALAPRSPPNHQAPGHLSADRGANAPRSPDSLRFPLQQAWRLALDPGREWALLPNDTADPKCVFIAGRGWLACRDVGDGTERWRQSLPFTPTWLTVTNSSLIVASDNGAARLSAADGRPAWQFRLPPVAAWFDRPGWRDPDAVAPADRLSGFRWAGGRLFARLGDRSLLALDGDTGIVLWQQPAPLAGLFHPAYFADGRCVAAQTADGRRWVFDAATGRTLHTGPAPADPWPTPPLALKDGRLLFVEDGRLVALDRSIWEPDWTWDLPRWPSLTGEPPQTRLVNGVLLVGVARNDCYEVERLDPATGRAFREGVVVGRERVDLSAVALDGDLLHVADGGELRTVDCRRNRVVACRKLEPAAHWRVEPAADGLLLWPVPVVTPLEPPVRPGRVVVVDWSEPERQRGSSLGPAAGLRTVRVLGNHVVVASAGEVRGYRGAKREVK